MNLKLIPNLFGDIQALLRSEELWKDPGKVIVHVIVHCPFYFLIFCRDP